MGGGGVGADSASDTPRRMSGWWSQCPWGKSSAPTDGLPMPFAIYPPLAVSVTWFGGTHRSRPTKCDETVCHSTGRGRVSLPGSGRRGVGPYGGCRCRLPFIRRGRWVAAGLAGHADPALRTVIVSVCHSSGMGGCRCRFPFIRVGGWRFFWRRGGYWGRIMVQ